MYPPYGCPSYPSCGGHVYRQVFYAPEPPPEQYVCRTRLPTPPPDIHEQTIVVPQPRRIIHEVVEQPVCPPPIVRTNYVMGPPQAPHRTQSTVQVCPSGSCSNIPGMMHGGLSSRSLSPDLGRPYSPGF